MRTGIFITLAETDRRRLEALVADRNTPQKHVWRARIVLMSADGAGTSAIMAATETAKTTVWRWQARFMNEGVDGLLRDKTRPPGRPPIADDKTSMVVAMPAHALVISIDEKSQIQALDRTQPGLPLKKGRGATLTHDYKRNGTTTLFAALEVLTGEVFGRNMQRHRHQEFIRFLNALERDIPAGKIVHVILDNYAAHKHEKVRAWLNRHPRWTFHFTPTSSSWLNAVEGFFAILTRRRLQYGVFRSVVDLQAAINRLSTNTTTCQSHSSGGPIPTPSSPHGTEGSKRWSQSTLMTVVKHPGQTVHAGAFAQVQSFDSEETGRAFRNGPLGVKSLL
ncbi:hypothetical protein M2323_004622 [Rhodoblastus acidophilus]|nr:hypothetical protein [Rhodoblastus acidophilus]MCW2335670.1 hypothetical protein [Rhodoblastus acidophilus]